MKEKDKKTIEDDRFITQTELDEECFTIQESKVMILDKIHRYFHHS